MSAGTCYRIFIAGDRYMRPAWLEEIIRSRLGAESAARFSFDSITFPYPPAGVALDDSTVVPGGMSWTDFSKPARGEGVEEFYGELRALKGRLAGVDVLLVHGAAVPASVLREAVDLKFIGVLRGGPKNIDLAAARELGIRLINTPGKTSRAVAEFMLGALLSLTRNIAHSYHSLRDGTNWAPVYYDWDRCGIELKDRALGLVGFGHIGEELARMLASFGFSRIMAFDPFRRPEELRGLGVEPAAFEAILAEADIVSLHARLTPGNRGMLGAAQFAAMRRKPIIVNTARGGLLDYTALIKVLKEGRVSGAVLDVFGDEPFGAWRELLAMPNVVCSPHVAGGSRETVRRAAEMIAEDLENFLRGRPLRYEM
jgi:D-3-phosphoglycerate dehydrogenase